MLLAAGTLHKLPEREGAIRLIEIDEIDLNACGGTHVQATGQIGGLLIRGTERMRQGLRVEFVCGVRAVVTARQDLATLTRAAAALSVGRLRYRKRLSGCWPRARRRTRHARSSPRSWPAIMPRA